MSNQQPMEINLKGASCLLLAVIVAVIGFCVALIYGISDDTSLNGMNALFIGFIGIGLILLLLIALAAILKACNLSEHPAAFALPSGTVRATLALSMVVIFLIVSILLVGLGDFGSGRLTTQQIEINDVTKLPQIEKTFDVVALPGPADEGGKISSVTFISRGSGVFQADIAKQILTTIATLLVTVIGFYFGSRSTAKSPTDEAAGKAPEPETTDTPEPQE